MTKDEAREYLHDGELALLDALTHPSAQAAAWLFACKLASERSQSREWRAMGRQEGPSVLEDVYASRKELLAPTIDKLGRLLEVPGPCRNEESISHDAYTDAVALLRMACSRCIWEGVKWIAPRVEANPSGEAILDWYGGRDYLTISTCQDSDRKRTPQFLRVTRHGAGEPTGTKVDWHAAQDAIVDYLTAASDPLPDLAIGCPNAGGTEEESAP